MNWRAVFLSAVLAIGLSLTFLPRVAADPLPWVGGWDDSRDYDRNDPPYYRAHRGYGDPAYLQLLDRIDNDRAKIAEIGATGRHREALQWYKDDLHNARRDMRNYRFQMGTIAVRITTTVIEVITAVTITARG
jgi:hypothetical protein